MKITKDSIINSISIFLIIGGIFLFIEGLFDVTIETKVGFVPINTLSGMNFMLFGIGIKYYNKLIKK